MERQEILRKPEAVVSFGVTRHDVFLAFYDNKEKGLLCGSFCARQCLTDVNSPHNRHTPFIILSQGFGYDVA